MRPPGLLPLIEDNLVDSLRTKCLLTSDRIRFYEMFCCCPISYTLLICFLCILGLLFLPRVVMAFERPALLYLDNYWCYTLIISSYSPVAMLSTLGVELPSSSHTNLISVPAIDGLCWASPCPMIVTGLSGGCLMISTSDSSLESAEKCIAVDIMLVSFMTLLCARV